MINPLDAAIVVILAASALVSLWRGFLREALSLAGWVLAAWVAFTYTAALDARLAGWVGVPGVRTVVAFLILFVATLFTVALVNFWLTRLVHSIGLSGPDRALGVLFGLLRGGVVVVLLLVLGRVLALDQAPWWQASRLRPWFQALAQWLVDRLPEGLNAVGLG